MMTIDKAIDCNLSLLEFMKIENMLHPNCVFADDNFEALEMANSALKAQSDKDKNVVTITDEQAIEHLQSSGWMQNHDREMYESGIRECLSDDRGSYDSLIPETHECDYEELDFVQKHKRIPVTLVVQTHGDVISRAEAINALKGLPTWWADAGGYYGDAQPPMTALLDPEDAISAIENLPSVQAEQKITHCENCKHRHLEKDVWTCPFGLPGGPKFFCGYGSDANE